MYLYTSFSAGFTSFGLWSLPAINMNNHVQYELPSNDLKPLQSPLFHGMPVLDGMSFRRKYVTGK